MASLTRFGRRQDGMTSPEMEKEAQNHQGKIVVLTSQHIQSYFLTWNEVQWSGGEIELVSIHLDLHLHHVVANRRIENVNRVLSRTTQIQLELDCSLRRFHDHALAVRQRMENVIEVSRMTEQKSSDLPVAHSPRVGATNAE